VLKRKTTRLERGKGGGPGKLNGKGPNGKERSDSPYNKGVREGSLRGKKKRSSVGSSFLSDLTNEWGTSRDQALLKGLYIKIKKG